MIPVILFETDADVLKFFVFCFVGSFMELIYLFLKMYLMQMHVNAFEKKTFSILFSLPLSVNLI